MRWASYYPPLVARRAAACRPSAVAERGARRRLLRASRRGALATARVEAARSRHRDGLRLEPGNATALALRGLLALARGDQRAPRADVDAALAPSRTSVVALIAKSHVEQSRRRARARRRHDRPSAARSSPTTAIALTRLAELALARGDARAAIEHATRARSWRPTQRAPLVVLGFAQLGGRDTGAAQARSSSAVELEPDAPLPRVGLALTAADRGDVAEGRRQLELAVANDPANALTRSYMAKVYDDRAPRRADDEPARSRQGVRSGRSDALALLGAAATARQSTRRGAAGSASGRANATAIGRLPLVAAARRGPRDAQRRARPRAHELGFGRLGAGRRVASRRPTTRRTSPLTGCSRTATRSSRGTRSRASASCSSRSCCSRSTSRRSSRSSAQPGSVHRAARGPEPRVVRRVHVAGRDERAQAARRRRSAGSNGTRGDDVAAAGLHDRSRTASATTASRRTGSATTTISSNASANAFVQFRPSYDTNLASRAALEYASEHGDLMIVFDRDRLFRPLQRTEEDVGLAAARRQATAFAESRTLLGSLILQDALTASRRRARLRVGRRAQRLQRRRSDIVRDRATALVQSGLVSASQDDGATRAPCSGIPDADRCRATTDGPTGSSASTATPPSTPRRRLTITAGASFDAIEIGSATKTP